MKASLPLFPLTTLCVGLLFRNLSAAKASEDVGVLDREASGRSLRLEKQQQRRLRVTPRALSDIKASNYLEVSYP